MTIHAYKAGRLVGSYATMAEAARTLYLSYQSALAAFRTGRSCWGIRFQAAGSPPPAVEEIKTKPAHRTKPYICAYSKTGNLLSVFDTIPATAHHFGLQSRAVREAIEKDAPLRDWYFRVCKPDAQPSKMVRVPGGRPRYTGAVVPVVKVCPVTCRIIETYPSCSEAAKALGVTRQAVDQMLDRDRLWRGFYWRRMNPDVPDPTTFQPEPRRAQM